MLPRTPSWCCAEHRTVWNRSLAAEPASRSKEMWICSGRAGPGDQATLHPVFGGQGVRPDDSQLATGRSWELPCLCHFISELLLQGLPVPARREVTGPATAQAVFPPLRRLRSGQQFHPLPGAADPAYSWHQLPSIPRSTAYLRSRTHQDPITILLHPPGSPFSASF